MGDRHQFRAGWHDYNKGIFFVTICCAQKHHYFGEIEYDSAVGTRLIASALGDLVEKHIINIPSYYKDVELLNHVLMPNHIHMVISIRSSIASVASENPRLGCLRQRIHDAPSEQDFHHNSRLATIVGAFKAGVTRDARTRLIYKIPESGVISRPTASTSCRSFFMTSAGIHFLSTLTVLTRLRLRTISIGANLLLNSARLSRSLRS